MENKAGIIEGSMKKALQRRIEIICSIASLTIGEEVFRDIDIEFKRNVPEDLTSTINVINALKGTVSDATLLGQLDFVTDVNAELEAVQEQRSREMELYSFGPIGADEEDEA
jgi:SPP1 family phage portal protein